ncbi:type II toxin-antitoxin system RelE/ParE family toxin [Sulfuricurvum sp.]|uniref:type II toxin-antitoxin system RelE/ParE family toxin n=1 Tax=Sulfuricurvum sp. TaxID=2025608 RepID=UPI002D3C4F25|nr:type II toxin-antitoxin system RelE/ParE family toxin [Sulfuricurvum sp.]HZF70300.1 type II toxin-antitoxin system RelE/ParE family toxin [Sulfuricurvum sp.]
MRIEYSPRFSDELFEIYLFIASDSIIQADQFISKLKATIEKISPMPYRHRHSLKSNDKEVRDLVYEGYVVVYRIVKNDKRIDIIGIFSENEWEL